MNYEEYNDYLDAWISGIPSEVKFWKDYMATKGDIYKKTYEKTVMKDKAFELENDIPSEMYGKDVYFADIGSGPFSRCGYVTDLVNLNFTAIDPLAEVYEQLKKKFQIDNGVIIKPGFVEMLSDVLGENKFDIVHMSNALDHSFDAVYGIYQLLFICKIGGIVILRHAENEAERSQYSGLHQWNLSLHNDKNTFLIWRKNEKYDICNIFKEYADFTMTEEQENTGWKYNKIVMVKKKNIKIPINKYKDILFNKIYSTMLNMVYDQALKEKVQVEIIDKNRQIIDKLQELDSDGLQEIMRNYSHEYMDIYGYGVLGREFYSKLKEYGFDKSINRIIDRKAGNKNVILLSDVESNPKSTYIIVCVSYDIDKIRSELVMKGYDENKIISIKQLLDQLI